MSCKHKWKTINTVSQNAYKDGSKKFRSGFEEADSYGIKILTARQKECQVCGKKRTTVEISKSQLNAIYQQLNEVINDEDDISGLSSIEDKVRKYLINVCKGNVNTKHEKRAMYKEVWQHVYPSRPFGRGNTNEVVEWIVNISNFDTEHDRPPLNSLVVRGDTGRPGDSWEEWKKYSNTSYESIDRAQEACWNYWV